MMKGKTIFRSVVYVYLVAIVVGLLFLTVFRVVELRDGYSLVCTASFIIIGVVSTYLLATSVLNTGISLSVIHWFFVLIFFFVVPFLQYLGGLYMFQVDSDAILIGNIYILLWCLIYWFFYRYATKMSKIPRWLLSFLSTDFSLRIKYRLYTLTVMSILVALYLSSLAGVKVFFTRALYEGLLIEQIGGWHPFGLIVTYYIRPLLFSVLIVFCGMLIYKQVKKTGALYLWLAILILVNAIVNNPFSAARFYAFTILFGGFVLILHRQRKSSLVYLSILLAGLLLSPIVDLFRFISSFGEFSLQFSWHFMFMGHFDAFENFIHTIDYVNEIGIVYGKQLLGALFFFVPRSIWIDKPVGSGSFIAEFLSTRFDVLNFNIANPLISELFLNFHVVSIIAGAVFYGVGTGWLDKRYWVALERYRLWRDRKERRVDFYHMLYPFLLGLFLFHLRGDFMSSFAYMSGFVLAFLTISTLVRIKLRGVPVGQRGVVALKSQREVKC